MKWSAACEFFLDDGTSLEIRLDADPTGETALTARALPEGNLAELRWIPALGGKGSRAAAEEKVPPPSRAAPRLLVGVDDRVVILPGPTGKPAVRGGRDVPDDDDAPPRGRW